MSDFTLLLGRKIKEQRKLKQISQENLAETVGISSKYLSEIECGKKNLTAKILFDISSALDVKTDDFFDYNYLDSKQSLKEEIISFVDDASEKDIADIYKFITYFLKSGR